MNCACIREVNVNFASAQAQAYTLMDTRGKLKEDAQSAILAMAAAASRLSTTCTTHEQNRRGDCASHGSSKFT